MKKISKKKKTYFGKDPEEYTEKDSAKKQSKKNNGSPAEFSKETIYAILENTPHPLRLDDILRRADVTRRSKKEVLSLLHELTEQGKIVHHRGGSYSVSASLDHVTGTLAVQRSGAGFVSVNKEDRPDIKEDIYIPEMYIGDAWNGDIVEVVLMPKPRPNAQGILKQRREGKVVSVLERTHKVLTVRLEEDAAKQQRKYIKDMAEHGYIASPTDSRFNFLVLVPLTADFTDTLAETENAVLRAGDLVRVKIGERLPSRLNRPLWLGVPEKFLGGQNQVSVQESIVKTSSGIPTEFPDDVIAEAENIARAEGFLLSEKEQKKQRIPLEKNDTDLRSLCLVTIDGADSRDFDDAVCAEKTDEGYLLTVAIADVSRYVTPYSKLDKEAKLRGNSYYFPNSVEPMLPEALSNGLCSLRPDEDHRIMFARILFNNRGQVKNTAFGQGVMRSKARLSYDAVQELFDTGKAENDPFAPAVTPEVADMLLTAKELAEILIQKRHKAGSLHLDIPEQKCIVKNDKVIGLGVRPHFFAHELIEAFMVAANEAVAEFLHKNNAPCLFRIHPAPAPERLHTLSVVFGQTALAEILPAESPDKIGESAWLSHILDNLDQAKRQNGIHASEDYEISPIAKNSYLAHRMILRSMMQARYSPYLDIHFGLASRCYCHFTSPIRRYADLMVHRSLKARLGYADANHKIFSPEYMEQTADICNEQERTAQNAEREVFRRLSCLMLEKQIGRTFSAVVSGLSNFGIFAELSENMAEGMIRMEKLGNDYFVYDEDRQILYGERTGAEYRLGDEITVKLEFVDITRLEIDLSLEGVTPRRAKGKNRLFAKTKEYPDKKRRTAEKSKPPKSQKQNSRKKDEKKSKSKDSRKKQNKKLPHAGEPRKQKRTASKTEKKKSQKS